MHAVLVIVENAVFVHGGVVRCLIGLGAYKVSAYVVLVPCYLASEVIGYAVEPACGIVGRLAGGRISLRLVEMCRIKVL